MHTAAVAAGRRAGQVGEGVGMTTIDELTTGVAEHLLRRGFVHDDPAAYRAGVRDALAAIRAAARGASVDEGPAGAEGRPPSVESPRVASAVRDERPAARAGVA